MHDEPGGIATRSYGERTVHYLSSPELIEELLARRHDSVVKINQVFPEGELDEHRGRLVVSEQRAEHVASRKALSAVVMSNEALARIRRALEAKLEPLVSDLPPEIELPRFALRVTAEVTIEQLFDPRSVDAHRLSASFERDFADETPFLTTPDAQPEPEGEPADDSLFKLVPQLASGKGPVIDALAPVAEEFDVSELERMIAVGGVYAAASETTARALAWLLGLLAEHPDVQDAVAAEVGSKTLADCELLRATVLETIRLYPPSWLIGRFAIEPTSLGETRLERHDVVLVCPYLMHRDPRHHADPDAFAPRRFVGSTPARWTFIPFGGGRRQCIGERVALAELETFAYFLLRTHRVSLPQPLPDPLPHLTLTPPPFSVALADRA